jgi:hypothetical protein
MDILKSLLIVITAILLVNCGAHFTDIPKEKKRVLTVSSLSGKLPTSDGGEVDLADDGGKPTILQFAVPGCSSCAHEAKNLRDNLKNKDAPPSKVRIITILNNAVFEDAQDWKQGQGSPWIVAYDSNPDPKKLVFRTYCATDVTPCLVVHTPEQGIRLSRNAEVSVGEIEGLTGKWED